MSQLILYILIAVNCVLFIANVMNALKLKTLITQMKKTRAQIGLGALYVRGVDVSDQFPLKAYGRGQDGRIKCIDDENGLVPPTVQSLSDAQAYEDLIARQAGELWRKGKKS